MKRVFIYFLFTTFFCAIYGQEAGAPASEAIKKAEKPKEIRVWRIDERLGIADTIKMDTAITNYQDKNQVYKYSIANSWNGLEGSPLQSKIYFDRTNYTDYLFSKPYDAYVTVPSNLMFFNTKTPFAELAYRTSVAQNKEEHFFRSHIAININKRLNVGGLVNYTENRGQYADQANQLVTGGVFASYDGRRYGFRALAMFNQFRNRENGGLQDDSYILDPQSSGANDIETTNYPVNLTNAVSGYRNFVYYYNHHYSLGIEKDVEVAPDSFVTEFIPVTSFIHTIKFEDTKRRYLENSAPNSNFYQNNFFDATQTNDSTQYSLLRNTLGVTLEEKFNKLMKFGVLGFVEHDLRHYRGLNPDSTMGGYYENLLRVGANLSKREGSIIKYDFGGDVTILGPKAGEFNVNGKLEFDFNIKNEPLYVHANGGVALKYPTDFENRYYSNHFIWDTTFTSSLKSTIKGRIGLPKRDISIGVGFENITNRLYFNQLAMPTQLEGNVQVLSFDLIANVKFWKMHFDNKIVYQLSSNQEVLPLPDLALYSNLYFQTMLFKVLSFQAGVSLRYHTAYYAPSYMPSSGVFYNQRSQLIGNYPLMNVYASLHLKRIRFYLQYYHFNKGLFGSNNYFEMPHYPNMPGTFQFGLSWTFYD